MSTRSCTRDRPSHVTNLYVLLLQIRFLFWFFCGWRFPNLDHGRKVSSRDDICIAVQHLLALRLLPFMLVIDPFNTSFQIFTWDWWRIFYIFLVTQRNGLIQKSTLNLVVKKRILMSFCCATTTLESLLAFLILVDSLNKCRETRAHIWTTKGACVSQ